MYGRPSARRFSWTSIERLYFDSTPLVVISIGFDSTDFAALGITFSFPDGLSPFRGGERAEYSKEERRFSGRLVIVIVRTDDHVEHPIDFVASDLPRPGHCLRFDARLFLGGELGGL